MNILFSITHLDDGGAQAFVARLANHLSKYHKVFVFCLDSRGPKRAISLFSHSITIVYPWSRYRLWIKSRTYLRKFARIFRQEIDLDLCLTRLQLSLFYLLNRIQVINSHLYHSDKLICAAQPLLQIPIVISDHGDYNYVIKQGLASPADVISIFRNASLFIACSSRNAETLSKLSEKINAPINIEKIFYGYDVSCDPSSQRSMLKSKLSITPDSVVFGMVARGIEEKGWAEALRAFTFIKHQGFVNCQLIFVGDSDYLQSLQSEVPNSIRSSVHFVGYSKNPLEWIREFDVGLLPTYFAGESLPCSIIEYFAAHKPVIATDIGGIREMCLVDNDLAGTLVPLSPNGKPSAIAIAAAMKSYLVDPSLLLSHSILAERSYQRFGISECGTSYINAFGSVFS